jgi:UDP-glucose 4-epimerase
MKFVVAGALGHIGSHVVRQLPVQFPDAEIIMLDNMMTQRFPSLFYLPAIGRYRFIEGDVTTMDLLPVFKGADVVVHLAAITDATSSFDKASLMEANNFQATLKVAEACVATQARLIALSSTSVYGTQEGVVDEDCAESELKPQSPYAETKLREEEALRRLGAEKRLRFVTCRLGTIFGTSPGMRFHTVVNKFCWQAVMGQPLSVWRTAYDQKRPYLDLFDAGRAISFIITSDLFDGRIYNVLTLNAAVRDIVDAIRAFVPDVQVGFVDSRIMNQLSYEVSRARFEEKGFAFAGNLLQAVGETIALLRRANGN